MCQVSPWIFDVCGYKILQISLRISIVKSLQNNLFEFHSNRNEVKLSEEELLVIQIFLKIARSTTMFLQIVNPPRFLYPEKYPTAFETSYRAHADCKSPTIVRILLEFCGVTHRVFSWRCWENFTKVQIIFIFIFAKLSWSWSWGRDGFLERNSPERMNPFWTYSTISTVYT